MHRVELWLGVTILAVILMHCCPTSARAQSLSEIAELLPDDASVICHVQANLDATPEKEWVVVCQRHHRDGTPLAIFEVVVFRRMADGWVKALHQDALDACVLDLEVRDLDNDGTLEVIMWTNSEDGWGFDTLDFVDGKLRLVWGLGFSEDWYGTQAAGFFDIDGDRKLELVVPAMIPGYLTALFPAKERVFSPPITSGTSDRDFRIYRFIKGAPVLYFPPLEVLPEGLKRGLASGYRDSRLAAAETAGILRVSEALPRLLALLGDPEERVAVAAVGALADIGGPLAAAGIISVLEDSRDCVSSEARQGLRRIGGSEAADAAAKLLHDSRPAVRAQAAMTLAPLGDREASHILLDLIEQGDWNVEYEAAARVLCAYGDEELIDRFVRGQVEIVCKYPEVGPAYEWQPMVCLQVAAEHAPSPLLIESCIALLSHPSPEVARGAARALGIAKSPAAVRALVEALSDERRWVQVTAAEALGMIGDASAIPALRKAAEAPMREVAGAAGRALVELGAPESLSLLLDQSRAGDMKATLGLAEMDGHEAREEVLRALRESPLNGSYAPRWGETMAADSAWGIGEGWFRKVAHRVGKPAVPILISRLDDVERSDSVAAAHCLRELGAVEAIPALLKVTASHPNPDAREVARWSVVALRRQGATWQEPLFPQIKQQPLEAYLGPGGAWEVTHVAVGNLDADPEAEFAVAYREVTPEEGRMPFPKIGVLDWQQNNYVLANRIEEDMCRVTSLALKDVNNDSVPEVLLRGDTGSVRHLAVYAWEEQCLRVLGSFDGERREPLLADLDGDDTYEVLIGSRDPNSKWWTPEEWFLSSCCLARWNVKACKYRVVSDADAVTLLGKGTKHAEVDVRKACVQGLGWTGSQQAVAALVEALSSEDEDMRGAAISALARIGGSEAAAALRDVATSDPDEALRSFAQDVIDRLW